MDSAFGDLFEKILSYCKSGTWDPEDILLYYILGPVLFYHSLYNPTGAKFCTCCAVGRQILFIFPK